MRAFRPGLLPTLVVLALLALLLALGGWQLQRADEKSALLASQEARRQAPAQGQVELGDALAEHALAPAAVDQHRAAAAAVAFEQLQQRPVVQLSGRVALQNLKIARTTKGSAGEPLLSWEALSVVLGTSEPLARRVHVEKLSLHAPQLHLARAANGRLNLSDLLPAASADEADPAPAPPWDVKLDGFELTAGALHGEAVLPFSWFHIQFWFGISSTGQQ